MENAKQRIVTRFGGLIMKRGNWLLVGASVLVAFPLLVRSQTTYSGANVTGLLVLSGTVDVMQQAQADAAVGAAPLGARRSLSRSLGAFALQGAFAQEFPKHLSKPVRPPSRAMLAARSLHPILGSQALTDILTPSLTVINGGGFNFNGLTQLDQRDANHGNQFTIEPPNPSIAVGNGYVLEGVNNAIQVYNTGGQALLPAVLATNELFALPPAIDRTTGIYGPFPTDMRVFYDPDIKRWFVLQRAQDEDALGDNLATSHLYLAVSQTSDPTGVFNIYTADTTDLQNSNCPCVDDYPQIGADRYGFYISSNEMNSDSQTFVDVALLGISKNSLASGAAAPTAFRLILPFDTGYEFSMQPATTPPGASYLVANGGVEYLASTISGSDAGDTLALWALMNTSSLATTIPDLTLTQAVVPTLSYITPNVASQRNGPLPYGSSLSPPGPLANIDGGDTRVLSLSYAGGRLYTAFSTAVLDQNNENVVGGALVVLSPTIRGGVFHATLLNQKYLLVNGNNLLRPSVAVNPAGVGEISATLVGPAWYPSAVFIPVSAFGTPSTAYVAALGTAPEDGFTGYTGDSESGIARWGDYSTAVAAADGTIWTVTEYIGNLPRTAGANWDTSVTQVKP